MSKLKRLLMIAYHFPPLAGSSGIQRTLRFVQHLPKFGWEPLVLVPNERAYERIAEDLMSQVPEGTVVCSAFALDAARHLAVGGRYIGALARPDRWANWRFDGVRQGMKMIREFQPQAIWSTYPIATAHVIGAELQRRSGLPWIADFRDPMAQDGYPSDAKTWAQYRDIEERAVRQASWSLFCTPSAMQEYRTRYPAHAHRIAMLENGYDEESFLSAEQSLPAPSADKSSGHVMLHSGIIYPSERDPTQLFAAMALLRDEGVIQPGKFTLRLRAAVHDEHLRALALAAGVAEFVELSPPIGYLDALREMLTVDSLLILQASNCNQQVPAKLYEYIRCRKPILALTDPEGDTAVTLRDFGIHKVARLDVVAEIAQLMRIHLQSTAQGLLPIGTKITEASRLARTVSLVDYLDHQ